MDHCLDIGDNKRMRRLSIKFPSHLWKTLAGWLSIALLVLMVVVPVLLLGWLVFFTNSFAVEAITVVDAREHTAAQAQTLVGDTLGKNILFVQTDILEIKILGDLPQVRTVHIARKLPGTLKVIIQEKEPVMLILSKGNYYFVDAEGIAYEQAQLDTLPGIVLPTIKNNDQEANLTIGTRVVAETFVQFIDEVQKSLPAIVEAQIVETRIPSLAAREVHVKLDNNWVIKLDITRDSSIQMSVLRQLLKSTVTDEEKQVLEYIDLRIPNRVYYRTRSSL